MSRMIEISDELFSEASRIAAQRSEDVRTVVERWASVGRVLVEAEDRKATDQSGSENSAYGDVARRMAQFMRENPVECSDIKKLIEEGRD